MKQSRHSLFKAVNKGDNSILSYVLTIVAIVIATAIGNFLYLMYVRVAGDFSAFTEENMTNFEALEVSEPIGFALLLSAFALSLFVLLLMVKLLHKRHYISVINPTNQFDWHKFMWAFGVYMGIIIGLECVAYFISPDNYTFSFDALTFFPLLLVVLIFIPLQTTFEEVIFRGYLMQGFGLLFKHSGLALVITSTIFGLMHLMNNEVSAYGDWIISYYIISGFAFGIIVIMDESLELAMGLHAANNVFGSAFVTFPESSLQTSTLFQIKTFDVGIMMSFGMIALVLFIVLAARKYGWSDYTKLWSKIE